MANVKLVNVTKRYGKTEALKNVSFEVKDKEFFIVAGPPGVGKTTLIRVIAGLEKVDDGEIYIGDELVNNVSPKDRDVSVVFENLAVYPNKTGFQNIAFPLEMRKVPKDEIRDKVLEVAKKLGIEHLLDRLPGTFSGGELQRVAVARAIVRQPRVYLLDQPLANLDAKIREIMRVELKKLARELGQTIIFSTHDQLEAMSMADRVAVMSKGVLQQYDTPYEIYTHPKNKFVANFIGSPSMNFIPCTYQEKDGKALLIHEAFTYDITELKDQLNKTATTPELILGIRPENISISSKPSMQTIKGKLHVMEPLGSEVILHLRVSNTPVKVLTSASFSAKIGSEISIEFDRTRIHIFESNTEKNILFN